MIRVILGVILLYASVAPAIENVTLREDVRVLKSMLHKYKPIVQVGKRR